MTQSKTPAIERSFTLDQVFSAFRHRNYRLWYSGQLVSLIGTWMQNTAQGYLVYQLTQSPAFLGYVGFAAGVPSILFTLYGGVVADRVSRRTMLIMTQTAMMILAFIMAILVVTGTIQPWMIIVLAFLLGVANAFDAPARLAIVVDLVEDRADLTNAIAMNASMFNLAAVVGPAIGGAIYALVGAGWCFTLNGLSFIAVLIALILMKIAPPPPVERRGSVIDQLQEGLKFLINTRIVLVLIITVGFLSTFGQGLVTLLPAWAVNVLHGDVITNGWLLAARGAGAFMGAIVIAAFGQYKIRGKLVAGGILLMPIFFILLALTEGLPPALILLFGIGMSFMMAMNSCQALVQTHVPDQLRGRVISVFTLMFQGGMPVGSLLAGQLAAATSEQTTVMICSAILLIYATVLFVFVPKVRSLG